MTAIFYNFLWVSSTTKLSEVSDFYDYFCLLMKPPLRDYDDIVGLVTLYLTDVDLLLGVLFSKSKTSGVLLVSDFIDPA